MGKSTSEIIQAILVAVFHFPVPSFRDLLFSAASHCIGGSEEVKNPGNGWMSIAQGICQGIYKGVVPNTGSRQYEGDSLLQTFIHCGNPLTVSALGRGTCARD